MRYILALMPTKQNSLTYIQAARAAFAPINDGYLLTENKSIPHITLCSFQFDESKIPKIYFDIQHWPIKTHTPHMMGLMLKKGKIPPNHYSVSLSVRRDSQLLYLHQLAVELLESYEVTILTPNKELYQPHLTLAGISWLSDKGVFLSNVIDDLLCMPPSQFNLVLGRGDDIGQYLETLFEFKVD